MIGSENSVVTQRLEVRHPVEADRPRFVELLCNAAVIAFSDGVLSEIEANARFDSMHARFPDHGPWRGSRSMGTLEG